VFRTLRTVFDMRLVVLLSCLLMSSFTDISASLMCFMLLLNRVLSESVCRLCPLVVSDLIDEDVYIHNRKHTVAATFVGAAGALGKFSQSLAPMLGYILIPNTTLRPVVSHATALKNEDSTNLIGNTKLGFIIVIILMMIVMTQRILWSRYTLHGKYLAKIKNERERKALIEMV
jgi:Na+/melibiose symporter-like transporter